MYQEVHFRTVGWRSFSSRVVDKIEHHTHFSHSGFRPLDIRVRVPARKPSDATVRTMYGTVAEN